MTDKKRNRKMIPEDEKEIGAEPAYDAGDETIELEIIDTAPEDELDELQKEVEEWRLKATEYLDGWQRARADFTNYKKRVERDQAFVYQSASASILKRFLDALDDLDRALKNRPTEGDAAAWAEGVELVSRKFHSILDAEGVKPMEAAGQEFDPNIHEAITQEESTEFESGQVIEVVKNGYWIGDKVLRPALVRVAK
jgi:molecular chaperone GrpE